MKNVNPGDFKSSLNVRIERIKANFAIRRLSDEDKKALDDLEKPNGEGRTIDFTEAWGVKLWHFDFSNKVSS